MGIDPRTSYTRGIFVVPIEKIIKGLCFSDIQIGHIRESEGYSDTWFDVDNAESGKSYYFKFRPSKVDGHLYFSAESYYYNAIPDECITGDYTYQDGYGRSYK